MHLKVICTLALVAVLTVRVVEADVSEGQSNHDPSNELTAGASESSAKSAEGAEVADHGSGEAAEKQVAAAAAAEVESLPQSQAHVADAADHATGGTTAKIPILSDDEHTPEEKAGTDTKDAGSGEGLIDITDDERDGSAKSAAAESAGDELKGDEGGEKKIVAEAQTDPQGDDHQNASEHVSASQHMEAHGARESGDEPDGENGLAVNVLKEENRSSTSSQPTEEDSDHPEEPVKGNEEAGDTNLLVGAHSDDSTSSSTSAPEESADPGSAMTGDTATSDSNASADSEHVHAEESSTSGPEAVVVEERTNERGADTENTTKGEDAVPVIGVETSESSEHATTEAAAAAIVPEAEESNSTTEADAMTIEAENTTTEVSSTETVSTESPPEAAGAAGNETVTDSELVPVTEASNSTAAAEDNDSANTNEIDFDNAKPAPDALDSNGLTKLVFADGVSYQCKTNCSGHRPQMTCLGALCNKSQPPISTVTCENVGNSTESADEPSGGESTRFTLPINWLCTSDQLEDEFQLKEPRVTCERYLGDSGHRWLVDNSCSLSYRIDRLNSSALQVPDESNHGFITGTLIMIACFGVAFVVIKAVVARQRHGAWLPAYCAMPLKARMNFRRKRQEVDDDEPVNVHFDTAEDQTTLGGNRQVQTYGNDR